MAYFHRYSAGADCMPPIAAAKYLACDDVCGRPNAVARQRFCPLQGLEFVSVFSEFRGRPGVFPQSRLSDAPTALFLISAAVRTEPWPATGTVLDLLAARVTGENALARGDARGYIAHVEIPFAGYARQRGTRPAFFSPGTGSID
jgi:hypothetical protein